MKITKKLTSLALSFVLVMTACADLDVTNTNAPDQSRALASPADVESLIKSTFLTWWQGIHVTGSGFQPMVMSDSQSSSWGNYGMKEMSVEPRAAINNSPAWGYAAYIEDPWYDLYGAISSAKDGLASLKAGQAGGKTFLEDAAADKRAEIFARWILAISNAQVASWYDKGFYVDGDTDFATKQETVDYDAMMSSAMTALEAVVTEMTSNSTMIIPEDWLQIASMTMGDLAKVGNSQLARYKVAVARSASERDAVNWADVASHAAAGATFAPVGDGDYWWTRTQYYSAVSRSWGRADYKMIGPADKSSGYSTWLGDGSDATVASRQAFTLDTDDKRITAGLDADGVQLPGLYGLNEYRTRLVASRGTYHQTYYFWNRQAAYATTLVGPMHDIVQSELDLYRAEAALRGGDAATAATLINNSRVTTGGLTAATASTTVGAKTDAPSALDNASLWAMLKYEQIIEATQTNPWLPFYHRRGHGDLVKGTATHLAIPGKELEILLMDNYTFGGQDAANAGTAGTAPRKRGLMGDNGGFRTRGFIIEWDKLTPLNDAALK